MKHLRSVTVLDEKRSHWVVEGARRPHGGVGRGDRQREARTSSSAGVRCPARTWTTPARCGSRTLPAGRGTVVRVELQYNPPAGVLGALVAQLWGEEPGQQIEEDLHRFKQLMEAGEIPTTEGQPSGRATTGPRGGAAHRRGTGGLRGVLPGQRFARLQRGKEQLMKAVCWYGTEDVRVETVPDPKILNPRDAIVTHHRHGHLRLGPAPLRRLHPDHAEGRHPRPRVHGRGGGGGPRGAQPEEGRPRGGAVHHLLRALLLLQAASCGRCATTPTRTPRWRRRCTAILGAGLFGYSHLFGGYAGGQAQYVRVPFADVGPLKIADGLRDEQVLFLSDIFPTGYMAAENCNIKPGDTVAVWGCGPVGQFAIRSAFLLGAGARDRDRPRSRRACAWPRQGGAETLDFTDVDVVEQLKEMTGGRGPDACIDAVGMEAHGTGSRGRRLRPRQAGAAAGDRPRRTCCARRIQACRKGGTVSDPRRLRRVHRQVPHRRGVRQGADVQDGPDARAEVHAAAAGAHPARARSIPAS